MAEDQITKIRRENLKALAQAAGSAAKLAALIDRPPALVNNYLSPTRVKLMGERFARHVEESLHLERGAMDREHGEAWATRDLVPSKKVSEPRTGTVYVERGVITLEQYDVRASMGEGIEIPEREAVIDLIRVPVEYVLERFPHISAPRNLKIITGFGNSMAPTFKHRDPLIVDVGVKVVDRDTVYVFVYRKQLYIKGLQRVGDDLKVISHNRTEADPFVIAAKDREEVNILARVICAVNMNLIS